MRIFTNGFFFLFSLIYLILILCLFFVTQKCFPFYIVRMSSIPLICRSFLILFFPLIDIFYMSSSHKNYFGVWHVMKCPFILFWKLLISYLVSSTTVPFLCPLEFSSKNRRYLHLFLYSVRMPQNNFWSVMKDSLDYRRSTLIFQALL